MALGRLKNGNPPYDLAQARRCGARCKRTGLPCRQPAMPNGRCRLHGGKSTGPKTEEGKARSRIGATKYGAYAGPNHPIYGETPGPLWPGLKDVRRQTREAMRRMGWKRPTGRKPDQPRNANGRFAKPLTNEEMAALVPYWWRD